MEIGKAFASARRVVPSPAGTVMPEAFVSYRSCRRTARAKLPASATRWKPMTSAPSSPSSTCRRHGSCEYKPYAGKGMWWK